MQDTCVLRVCENVLERRPGRWQQHKTHETSHATSHAHDARYLWGGDDEVAHEHLVMAVRPHEERVHLRYYRYPPHTCMCVVRASVM